MLMTPPSVPSARSNWSPDKGQGWNPAGLLQAAHLLSTASFDDLWNVVDARFAALGWARQERLELHRGLQEFYGQAASAGHAVVKAVWA
ncbi:hypothetical protein [Streptomyces sp. NPDC005780]|uniref:hypothetical protein n=1 Tax=Streptomyces sp. NPDC005780 TaxID=3364730 RepID=UPI0036B9CEA0